MGVMPQVPFVEVMRVWLACIWIIAGVLKAVRPAAVRAYVLRRFVASDRVSKSIVAVVCLAEIAIGVALLGGFMLAAAAGLTVVLLVVFTLVVLSDEEGEHGCGCFGVVDETVHSGWTVIVRNAAMVAAALFIALAEQPVPDAGLIREPLAWVFGVTMVVLSGVVYVAGARLLAPLE